LVGPSDLLFIPPFWWHHFECISPLCLSVSEWTRTPDYFIAGEARRVQRLWQWPHQRTTRVAALHTLLVKLLVRLRYVPHLFMRDAFVRARYGTLRVRVALECTADVDLLQCATLAAEVGSGADGGGLDRHVERLDEILGGMSDDGAREMAVADFVEQTTADALGAQSACAFLTACFPLPRPPNDNREAATG
jgi:hypothetical protein